MIFSLIELAFVQSKLAAEPVEAIPMHKQMNIALFIEYFIEHIVDNLPILAPGLNAHILYVYFLDYPHLYPPLLLGVKF